MIYIVTHKNIEMLKEEGYIVIGVGDNNILTEDVHDDTFDNISTKNLNYCELTALYWIWKNTSDDIIGLTHYRRLFMDDKLYSTECISYQDATDLLKEYDIILPTLHETKFLSVYEHYKEMHKIEDLEMIIEIVKREFPQYLDGLISSLKGKYEYGFNMFIAKREVIDEYCKYLFKILNIMEKNKNLDDYDEYQKRVYGFLAERIFTGWIMSKKLKIKELPIKNPYDDNLSILNRKVKKLTSERITLYE